MADIKISELAETTDLNGLYTIGTDKNNSSKKVALQFIKDAADYANAQGDYAKQAGDLVNGNAGVTDYPVFSASATYSAGDVVRYNGVLYEFTGYHSGSWNGNDVVATSINSQAQKKLTELESEINIKLGINEQHTYTSDDFTELYYRTNDSDEGGVFVDYTTLDYSGIIIPLKKGVAYSKVGESTGVNYWLLTKEKPTIGASAPNMVIQAWPYIADGTYNYLFLNVKMSSFKGVTLTEYASGLSNEIQELETALNRTDNQLTEVANVIDTITFEEMGEELTSADASSDVLISPSNGKETAYDGARASGYISVVGGSNIYISASMAWSNALYAFYDANKTFIESRASAGGSTITVMLNEKVAVPANAAYVRVCDYSYAQKGKVYAEKKVVGIKDWIGKKWVCVGDSLTEKNSRATMNYHDYVAEATGIEVVNMGVSGTGYKRQEESGNAFYQRVENIPTDADVITIFGSGNDGAYWGSQLGTASDTTTDTIGGCMNITIDNILARMPLAVIGIVSPCPWGSYPPSTENAMKRYSALLKQICERRGIPFLDLYLNSGLRPWDATFRELAYSRDDGGSVHPDETGHKLIAPRFKAFLETLIM